MRLLLSGLVLVSTLLLFAIVASAESLEEQNQLEPRIDWRTQATDASPEVSLGSATASVDAERGHPGLPCSSCHVAGSSAAHIMFSPELETCQACHTENSLGVSHPVGGGLLDPLMGKEMTCVSTCHSEHEAQGAKLIQATESTELCRRCHPEKF